MMLTGKFSMILGAALWLGSASDGAEPKPREMPISKVWPRSAPNARYLTPPALLRAGATSAAPPTTFSGKVDLNRGSLQQLQDLPGVGPALGARLMAGRPYRTLGDVARVGIPLNTIEQIAPLIEMGP